MQERPRPLETAYYDLLGVPVDATTDDIKKPIVRQYVIDVIPFILSQLTTPVACRLPHDQVRIPPRQESAPRSECRRTS